jgi:CspA family cold shock protein
MSSSHLGGWKAGLGSLNEGDKVSYEVVANRGKESAENLRVG